MLLHNKEDLVFDKHSRQLIGLINSGDINAHLQQYEGS